MKSITADRNKIAPCGLNCAVCSEALRKESSCVGCRNEGYKGEYCANICKIVKCEIRKTLPDGFCDECPQYPCREIVDKECWYANDYPMIESLMGNLAFIRENGIEKFLQREKERWTCSDCGRIISVHDGICYGCGKNHTDRKH